MDASQDRYVILLGLDVRDDALYAEYRAAMLPILEEYRGYFEYDLTVGKLLKSKGNEPINRVFTISFPNREARARFFADDRYVAVRARYFEPAVAKAIQIAEFDLR